MYRGKLIFIMTGCLALLMGPVPVYAGKDNKGKHEKPVVFEKEIQMLEAASSGAGKAPPALQAHICLQVSIGYAQVDRSKAVSGLKRCFRQTLSITDKIDADLQLGLQLKILDMLFQEDEESAVELSRSADPRVRTDIESRVVTKLTNAARFDEAVARINGFSYATEFPYPAAASLMLALPADRDPERRLVFTAALNSYRLRDPEAMPGLEDLGTLIVRFWKHLPPLLVLQAIDEVLNQARKSVKDLPEISLTVGTGIGEAQFSTRYQFRLFELLPVIQALDSSRAAAILRDNPALAAVLRDYPQGLRSLEPTYRDTPLQGNESPRFAITLRTGAQSAGPDPVDLLVEKAARESQDLVNNWFNDPEASVKKATHLPEIGLENRGRSPRADALSRIAAMSFAQRPEIAAEALHELLRILPDYPLIPQGEYLIIAAGIAFRMGDLKTADDLLEKAFDLGSKLYAIDSNPDLPNKAFKLDWPSAAVWRACVLLQDRIDETLSMSVLKKIKDPEILSSIQIALANTRMGVALPVNLVRQQFGDGPGSTRTLPIPH